MDSPAPPDRDDVVAVLRSNAPELRGLGVRHLAVFGSVARGEAGPDSDVDVLLDLDPAASLLRVVRIRDRLTALLGRPVDVAELEAMRPTLREAARREAVHAF